MRILLNHPRPPARPPHGVPEAGPEAGVPRPRPRRLRGPRTKETLSFNSDRSRQRAEANPDDWTAAHRDGKPRRVDPMETVACGRPERPMEEDGPPILKPKTPAEGGAAE